MEHDPDSKPLDNFPLSQDAKQLMEQFRRERETKVLTLFFSDLVGSAELQFDFGNHLAAQIVQTHYRILRSILAEVDGREISTSGDSMLVVFAAPADAVKFALLSQRRMREEQHKTPQLPSMRCGIHHGQVVLQKGEEAGSQYDDVYGVQVSLAARIMSLAAANQVLTSRSVFDDAKVILAHERPAGLGDVRWVIHGSYRFKGIRDNYEVCEVGESEFASFVPPHSSEKAERVAEQLNGTKPLWQRPLAVGAAVLVVLGLIATFIYQGTTSKAEAKNIENRERLLKINKEIESLSGLDDCLVTLKKLELEYQQATDVIFGAEPSLVRTDALKVLARLKQYELNDDEKAIAAKAEALSNKLLQFYPEEVYVPVRELFESMKGRHDRLLRERNALALELPSND